MARRDRLQPQRSLLLGFCRSGSHQRRSGPLSGRPLALAGLALGLGLACSGARAQAPSPNQPLAIDGLPPPPCPLLVPASDSALQPLRIQPSQVAGKNAMGCLSPADAAVYGPDGCPVKLCHAPQGSVPLPKL